MSAEEKKRFDALTPRKRPYGDQGGYKNQNYSSYNAAMSPRNDSLISKDELMKLLQPAGKGNPAAGTVRGWATGPRTVRNPRRPRPKTRSLSSIQFKNRYSIAMYSMKLYNFLFMLQCDRQIHI